MAVLRQSWVQMNKLSKLNLKHVHLQDQVLDNVLMMLLGDEDVRVRHATAVACVK